MGHIKPYQSKLYVVGSTPIEICSPNDRRSALLISAPTRGTIYLSDSATVTVLNGIPLSAINGPVLLTTDTVGELVQRGLWAISSSRYNDAYVGATATEFAYNGAAAPGNAVATVTPGGGNHLEIDGISGGVDKDEIFRMTLTDATPTTYLDMYGKLSRDVILPKPIIMPSGLAATVTVYQSATSTKSYGSISGREVTGANPFSFYVNVVVVEIFNCPCDKDNDKWR